VIRADIRDPTLDCMGHGDTPNEVVLVKRRAIPILIKTLFIFI
jgi:hypothetical protein